VTHGGASGSNNVGTSNRNVGEIPTRRKTKVSLAMIISQGLVGPKGMAIAGPDGQTVNIPSLRVSMMRRRSAVCLAYYWIYVHVIRIGFRKIRNLVSIPLSKCCENFELRFRELNKARFQEKSLNIIYVNPYLKPTQVVSSSRARRMSDRFSRNSAKKQP
jgi:hypothetical protein